MHLHLSCLFSPSFSPSHCNTNHPSKTARPCTTIPYGCVYFTTVLNTLGSHLSSLTLPPQWLQYLLLMEKLPLN